MGVKDLTQFILTDHKDLAKPVDLFHEARTRDGGIELLVDFYAFENAFLKSMCSMLGEECRNYYIGLGLGEYATIDEYLKTVIEYLRRHYIKMVFYIDGARGSSTDLRERKLDTWKERHESSLADLNYFLGVCDGTANNWSRPKSSVLPVLLESQFFETLKECSETRKEYCCEINQLPSGEVDCTLAKQLLERPKAFAVLGYDTDFCIFKKSAFIHLDWFEMAKYIGLGKEASASDCLNTRMLRQETLNTRMLRQETLSKLLELEHHDSLIEFAILCGNDFTHPHLERLKLKAVTDLKNKGGLFAVADWIKRNGKIDIDKLAAEQPHDISTIQKLKNGIEYSRIFYSLGQLPEELAGAQTGPMTSYIAEGIRALKFPATVMSMHKNYYWHRHLLENTSRGQPSVEEALTKLRRNIYGLLLPGPDNFVMEYGRTPEEDFKKRKVEPVFKGLPKINQIHTDSIEQNMEKFYQIMTHPEEPAFSPGTNDNNKTKFLVYVLRYFLVMNTGENLKLRQDEFESLVATVFAGSDINMIKFYQELAIRPSVRCVTVGNWFQAVYLYAFDYIGKILKVSGEFPLPKEVFSGSVWTVFYTLGQASGGTVLTTVRDTQEVPLDQPLRNRAEEDRSRFLEQKANLITIVTHGVKLENRNSEVRGASGHQRHDEGQGGKPWSPEARQRYQSNPPTQRRTYQDTRSGRQGRREQYKRY